MKKLLVIIMFVLMVLPSQSQTVEKVVTFYGEISESSDGVKPISGKIKVKFLSNGDIHINGMNYEPYYNTYAHGCQVGFNDCNTYKKTFSLGGYDATYLIVRKDCEVLNFVHFAVIPPVWSLRWLSTDRYVAKGNGNNSLGL